MTDRNYSVHFWKYEKTRGADSDVDQALLSIGNTPHGDYVDCRYGRFLRIERLEEQGDYVFGDIVRQQR